MFHPLLHVLAEVGPVILLIVGCIVCLIVTLVLYIGIAMWAVMRARDTQAQTVRYRVFRDLLNLVRVVVCELVKLLRGQGRQ
jgi:hypothetical protein